MHFFAFRALLKSTLTPCAKLDNPSHVFQYPPPIAEVAVIIPFDMSEADKRPITLVLMFKHCEVRVKGLVTQWTQDF